MENVLQIPAWLEERLEKPVAILGRGGSGRAASKLISRIGGSSVFYDESGGEGARNSFDAEAVGNHDLVVFSPGFPLTHQWIRIARESKALAIPEFDLSGSLWQGPVIAVTGTNGKTTLTEFLNSAFRSAGIESYAAGNIGTPLSELIATEANLEAIVVCEISSFQAEAMERMKIDYSLWTNFDEDHLDRHESLKTYFDCKYDLASKAPSDCFFFDESVQRYASEFGRNVPESGLLNDSETAAELGVTGTIFETQPELRNYQMARALWRQMKLPEDELVEAAHSFQKSPHRMEMIDSVDGISFWNDSKATNFHAVINGLSRFERPVIWIGGGKRKGGDVDQFAERLSKRIRQAVLIGETAGEMAKSLENRGIEATICDSLDEAVQKAFACSGTGDNVILSPGFSSHDMFESYAQRGDYFKKAVNAKLEE